MKLKRVISALLVLAMVFSLGACNNKEDKKTDTDSGTSDSGAAATEEELDYTFGLDTTFKSDEPITYSMMYSDHEIYPYQENWLVWDKIKEMTNVSFDLNIIARADYDDKKSLLINSGEAPYIIPKTYDESAFITGGAVVPISEWVQYMPNYMNFVETYQMEDDLKQITKSDGKYYKLPGMWEVPAGTGSEYTLVVRKDIFEKAGVDVTELEKDWTWDEFYDCLAKVQNYVGGNPIWSDRWKGDSLLKVVGQTYNVPAGWSLGDGMQYDAETDSWYFAETSEDYKEFVTLMNKFISSGILDPETFTQEDATAENKFKAGETYVIGSNRTVLSMYDQGLKETLGEGNYELYSIVLPVAKNNYQTENSRLENGIMISQKALDELGEAGFIKMLRFIDWLWYSEEGKIFTKWGVEGETYTVDSEGNYTLNSDITYNGLNPEGTKQLNVDYGFSNGVFSYGGTLDLAKSMLADDLKDFCERLNSYRTIKPLNPPVVGDEDQTEEMNLIKTPLMDYVKSATLQFVTGQMNVESDWDSYVASCEANNSQRYIDMYKEIYDSQK
ncbi:type 2 periplasmic-binding domain-containing protein [Anaeromicropila populeti]|nr:extracellular solute-binding protein [Anaeromicropila populeti]